MQLFFKKYAVFVFLFIASIFPVFLYLGNLPFSSWDESLFAMRAYHLLEEGEILFNFNEFDQYRYHANRKPILTTILQVLVWKIFGISELGLRMPTAIMGLILIFIPFIFKRRLGFTQFQAFVYSGLFISSSFFVRNHILRTGDQDVMVALYMLLQLIFFYLYIESSKEKKNKYLIWFVLFTLFCLFTKTIFAFMFFPGFLLYAIFRNKINMVLKDKLVWLSVVFISLLFVIYNLLMEHFAAGFIEGYINHALGRYGVVVDGQETKGFSFYWKLLFNKCFKHFVWLLFLSPLVLIDKDYKNKKFYLLIFVTAISFVLVISLSSTKLFWYLFPAFSLFVFLLAFNIQYLFGKLRSSSFTDIWPVWSEYVILVFVFLMPYASVMNKVRKHKDIPYYDFELEGAMVKRLNERLPEEKEYVIMYKGPNPQISFYSSWYNAKKDYSLSIDIRPLDKHEPGTKVMSCLYSISEEIRADYDLRPIYDWKSCHLWEINGFK